MPLTVSSWKSKRLVGGGKWSGQDRVESFLWMLESPALLCMHAGYGRVDSLARDTQGSSPVVNGRRTQEANMKKLNTAYAFFPGI
jgi:hypothetical protein